MFKVKKISEIFCFRTHNGIMKSSSSNRFSSSNNTFTNGIGGNKFDAGKNISLVKAYSNFIDTL